MRACHCSLYLAAELCDALPAVPCALTLSPLIRALLEELRSDPPSQPQTPEQQRLLQVLVDKLAQAPHVGSYLPSSDDPLLGPVLRALEANPSDPRSLPQLARAANTTERTLMRRAQRDLGMSLVEWRQRLESHRSPGPARTWSERGNHRPGPGLQQRLGVHQHVPQDDGHHAG